MLIVFWNSKYNLWLLAKELFQEVSILSTFIVCAYLTVVRSLKLPSLGLVGIYNKNTMYALEIIQHPDHCMNRKPHTYFYRSEENARRAYNQKYDQIENPWEYSFRLAFVDHDLDIEYDDEKVVNITEQIAPNLW